MMYEIFYSNGGHSGSYASKLSAKMSALQRLDGDRTMDWVDIRTSSIRGTTIARIARDDLCHVIDELGTTVPSAVAENNVAIFTVEATVIMVGVSDMELNNSKVLHPDVLEQLSRDLAASKKPLPQVTLEEVYET